MPVRIYDIARKLGIESKKVLAKAKELGITAKVPSSSLDKITAEYLEQQIGGYKPESEPSPAPASPEPVVIVAPPAEEEKESPKKQKEQPEQSPGTSAPESESVSVSASEIAEVPAEKPPVPEEMEEAPAAGVQPSGEQTAQPAEVGPGVEPQAGEEVSEQEVEQPVEGEIKAPPPEERSPQVGDKVGFIKLPPKPAARSQEKPGAKAQPRGGGRAETGRVRGGKESREGRGVAAQKAGPSRPAGAPGKAVESPRPTPTEPEFVPPSTGELITLKPPIVVRQLAEHLKIKPFKLIADLIEMGVLANVNQAIEESTAQRVCAKYGYRFEVEKRERGGGIVHAPVRRVELDIEDKEEELRLRPPVVTIMGHVDHGKTTLLDVIRKSNVVAGETGGITQHIGAYTIYFPHPERPNDLQQLTFLDTPGHAAFSAMRARGADVTDVVILVVAANDGVMPQTMEALNHAKAANVPIIVAVNKCDHPNADPTRVRTQLQEKGLVCEEWGGDTIFQDVSALTKEGIDKLLELVLLQAEIMELKANPNRRAKGNVIESGLEAGGPTATLLVRKGTLRMGDVIICGQYWGKARALINEEGKRLKEAGPSVAVKLLGLNGVPEAGLEFSVVKNDKEARHLAEERAEESRQRDKEQRPKKVTLESLFADISSDSAKVLKIVAKADTQGSIEAIVDALKKIESEKVNLDIIHSGVGTVTESDVVLASASKAIIIGFHTRVDNTANDAAKREGVQIKLYSIIYELIDEVKEAMAGLLEPVTKESVTGSAEVRKVFALSKGGHVAGCVVASGRLAKGKCRVIRRKGVIYEGVIQTLRRFQDEVSEVRTGMECGIRIDGFNDFEPGDMIEGYTVEKVAQKL